MIASQDPRVGASRARDKKVMQGIRVGVDINFEIPISRIPGGWQTSERTGNSSADMHECKMRDGVGSKG